MELIKPFGGINEANYLQAINPGSDRYILNTSEQKRYDSFFNPQEVQKNPPWMGTIFTVAIITAAYFIFIKNKEF